MLAIKNFGHFWNRKYVNWGRRARDGKGQVLGYTMWERKPWVVDFSEQVAIYVLYTESREVVYIGQTGRREGDRLIDRLRAHSKSDLRERWTHFSWFGMKKVNETNQLLSEHQQPNSRCTGTHALALDEIEAILLQLFEPRLNKQGPRWGDSWKYEQYLPWEWEEVDPPYDPQFQNIRSQLTSIEQQLNKFSPGKNDEVVE